MQFINIEKSTHVRFNKLVMCTRDPQTDIHFFFWLKWSWFNSISFFLCSSFSFVWLPLFKQYTLRIALLLLPIFNELCLYFFYNFFLTSFLTCFRFLGCGKCWPHTYHTNLTGTFHVLSALLLNFYCSNTCDMQQFVVNFHWRILMYINPLVTLMYKYLLMYDIHYM